MVKTYRADHEFIQGEDYQFELDFESEIGLPLNLAGFTFAPQIWTVLGDLVAVGSTVSISPSMGTATFKFSAVDTQYLAWHHNLLVKVIGATGNVQYAIRGVCQIFGSGKSLSRVFGSVAGSLPSVAGVFSNG